MEKVAQHGRAPLNCGGHGSKSHSFLFSYSRLDAKNSASFMEEDVFRRTKGDFYDETVQESKGYLRPWLCERDGQDPCVYREQPESYVHWYRRVCKCLDGTGILHERNKPDPGQWSGTSCLQQRRIISDSQRHLSRQELWRNLQLFFSSRTGLPEMIF